MKLKLLSILLLAFAVAACSESPTDVAPTDEKPNTEEPASPAPTDLFGTLYPEENDEIKFDATSLDSKIKRTFYVDGKNGNDGFDGLSQNESFKSLERLLEVSLTHGDRILIKGYVDHMYTGMVSLVNLEKGDGSSVVHVGSYGECKARIDAAGYPAGVLIDNSSNVYVTDLKITADGPSPKAPTKYMLLDKHSTYNNRYGVFIDSSAAGKIAEDIEIYNVDIRDVYYYPSGDSNIPTNRPCREWSTNYETEYGWGIRGYNASSGRINRVKIHECNIRDVSHTGIKFVGLKNDGLINDLDISKCQIHYAGGPGAQFARCKNGKMYKCVTKRSGASISTSGTIEKRKWGRGSGMWIHSTDGFLFEYNHYERAEGIADCCGAHIDIGNTNVIIQYCVSIDNMGGFVEVLGENKNCAYRYNVSINDGWRNTSDPVQTAKFVWGLNTNGNPIGTKGALVTINGHTTDLYVGPYQTYIYNNTIINHNVHPEGFTNTLTYELATSAEGILMANNLFWVDGQMSASGSTHKTEFYNGAWRIVDKAFDYRISVDLTANGGKTVRNMTAAEIEALNHDVSHNLFRYYDPNNSAQKYLPVTNSVEYWDNNPIAGDPQFTNPTGMNAADFVPQNTSVINQGRRIEKLASDQTNYGTDFRDLNTATTNPQELNLPKDIFGNPISGNIIGAIAPNATITAWDW